MEINTKSRFLGRRSFLKRAAGALLALGLGRRWIVAQAESLAWDDSKELRINFSISAPNSGKYHNPYVAVWIENTQGQALRTLGLWVKTGKGERWIPELSRWYRGEKNRQNQAGGNLIKTVSSPTRLPGTYQLIWDGFDDKGHLLNQGDYYVCIETAREKGPYHLIRELISLTATEFSSSFNGAAELGNVSVEYRSRS